MSRTGQLLTLATLPFLLGGCVQLAPPQLERQSRAAIAKALAEFEGAEESVVCVVDDVPIRRFVPHQEHEALMLHLSIASGDLPAGFRLTAHDEQHRPYFVPIDDGCTATVRLEASYFMRDDLRLRYDFSCGDLCGQGGTIDLQQRGGEWRIIDRHVSWIS